MRISETITAMVEKAVEQHAPGEGVGYDVGTMLMPVGQQQVQIAVHVILTLPALVPIGARVANAAILQDLHPSEVAVDQLVTGVLDGLRQQRSAMAAQANGQPVPQQGLSWDGMEERGDWNHALGEGS